jgi:S-adenosylmethionine synthetase
MQPEFMFTSESVTEGHPDKLCDQISDAVVGHYLRQDPRGRVMAECAVSTGVVFLSVKYRADASVDVADVAREVIRRVGYEENGFNAKNCSIMTSVSELPPPHASRPAPDEGNWAAQVVEDQATLFGFACDHTPNHLPLPIALAHTLARGLDAARRNQLRYLAPDGKTQVGVEFRGRRPHRIHSVTLLVSQREAGHPSPEVLERDVRDLVLSEAFAGEGIRPDARTRIAINPEGPIVGGGPASHAGLTGRKTAVDTYGEFSRHSGAALSGKDIQRIDRVGAYAARQAARSVIVAGLAELCEVQLSYSVGLAAPVSVQVETYGTARIAEEEISNRVQRVFDFRLGAIVEQLRLRELVKTDGAFLRKLSVYGHVGRSDLALPWEAYDNADRLR